MWRFASVLAKEVNCYSLGKSLIISQNEELPDCQLGQVVLNAYLLMIVCAFVQL